MTDTLQTALPACRLPFYGRSVYCEICDLKKKERERKTYKREREREGERERETEADK